MFLTQALFLLGTLSSQPDPATTRALVVLLDISGSMGIDDAGKSRLVRGCDIIKEMFEQEELVPFLEQHGIALESA